VLVVNNLFQKTQISILEVKMLNFSLSKLSLIFCIVWLVTVNQIASAQSGFAGEELIKLNLTVKRGTAEVSINQVPNIRGGDKLKVGIADDPEATNQLFDSNGYNRLIIIFLPISDQHRVFNERSFVVDTRRLRRGNTNNNDVCFNNCVFDVPTSYSSIPIIFLVSDINNILARTIGGNYKRELRDFVVFRDNERNIDNHKDLIKFGESSLSMTAYPRKVQFIRETLEILQTKPAKDTKVLRSLSKRAFDYFELGVGNECKKAGNDKKLLLETVKEQFQCLAKPEHFDIKRFEKIGDKLNWKDISRELASEAVSQLIRKFPAFGSYVGAAVAIIEILQPILEKLFEERPLVINSAIATEDEFLGKTFTVYDNPGTQADEPSSRFSRAVFFVPFRNRERLRIGEEKKEILKVEEVRGIQPLPSSPCLVKGTNSFRFPDNTSQEETVKYKVVNEKAPLLLKLISANAANPSQSFTYDLSLQDTKDGWVYNIEEAVWQQINQWEKANNKVVIDYNLQNPFAETKTFSLLIGNQQSWSLKNAQKFRREMGLSLQLEADNTNCLEKVVFYGLDNNQNEVSVSSYKDTSMIDNAGKITSINARTIEVSFDEQRMSEIKNGNGRIEVYQYGIENPVLTQQVNLSPAIPKVTNFSIYQGERAGVLDFDNATQEQLQDIASILFNDEEMGFEVKERKAIYKDSGKFAISGNLNLNLVMKDGTKVPVRNFAVRAPRPSFKTDSCIINNIEKEYVFAQWNTNSKYETYQLTNCEIIPIDIGDFTLTLRPANTSYNFTANQPFTISAIAEYLGAETEVSENNVDCNSEAYITVAPDAIQRESIFPQEMKLRINSLNLPKKLTCSGWRLRISLRDRNGVESYYHTVGQTFVELPQNPSLVCKDGANSCELRANGDSLNKAVQVQVANTPNDENKWIPIVEEVPQVPKPVENEFIWLKLKNGAVIKLKTQ
jgi:hypothetical protein